MRRFRAPLAGLVPALLLATGFVGIQAKPVPLEDATGFPKTAVFRPGTISVAQTTAFDWAILDGTPEGVRTLIAAKKANPALVTMILPYKTSAQSGTLQATYGFTKLVKPMSSPWGTLRAKRTTDDLLDPDGRPHQYGTVTVLNLQQHGASDATAEWSARVRAKYFLENVRGRKGIDGVWGDNDFWSDQVYAWRGVTVNAKAWNDGFVATHRELSRLLPRGTIIGGNDLSSMAAHPGNHRASEPGSWRLLGGLGRAGMKEYANAYGMTRPEGLDGLVRGIRAFLALKRLDGLQRYMILNVAGVRMTSHIGRLGLATASIAGAYYWGYPGVPGDFATTLATSVPEATMYGRHWLGAPTGDPVRLAAGLWLRTFEHGTVVANSTGSSQTVAGVTVPDEDGAFIRR